MIPERENLKKKIIFFRWVQKWIWVCGGIFIIGASWEIFCNVSVAGELRELYRGARAQAMGGAFVGLADDEQAIFLNPAGLAGNKKFSLNYVALDLVTSADVLTSYQDGLNAFKNLSGDSLNVIIGKNIYAQAQMAPSLLMPNLGIALLVDGQAALLAQNKALPQITIGYQTTNGFQVAYGMTVGRGFRQRGDLRVGAAAKLLYRRGGYNLIPMMDLVTISQDTLSAMTGGFSRGMGLDFGSQYIHHFSNRLDVSLGLAFTDVGDTAFGPLADTIKSNLTAGLAVKYALRISQLVFTYDYRHILDQTDWRKKSHLGIELGLPFISLYGGINQVSLTYGAMMDLWWFRITTLTYVEELGSFVHQDSMRRWVLKLGMKFNL